MSLFDNCKLPNDERALEILQKISDLWEDNAYTKNVCSVKHPNPYIWHERISIELKEALINLSVTSPHILEEMLNEEASLHNILQLVAED